MHFIKWGAAPGFSLIKSFRSMLFLGLSTVIFNKSLYQIYLVSLPEGNKNYYQDAITREKLQF